MARTNKAMATKSASQVALIQDRINRNKNRVKVTTGNKIQLKNQKFNVDGKALSVMGGVVVEFMYFNRYDERPYREGDPTPPECFAFAMSEADMKPDPSSPKPQAPTCSVCSHNQWDKKLGRKLCRNKIRVALLPVGDPKAEFQILEVPPTSLKSFQVTMKEIHQKDGDHAAFTYEFELDGSVDYAKFGTTCTGDNADYEDMLERVGEAEQALQVGYDYSADPTPAPRKSATRRARK
jgi:hypothetical protein